MHAYKVYPCLYAICMLLRCMHTYKLYSIAYLASIADLASVADLAELVGHILIRFTSESDPLSD